MLAKIKLIEKTTPIDGRYGKEMLTTLYFAMFPSLHADYENEDGYCMSVDVVHAGKPLGDAGSEKPQGQYLVAHVLRRFRDKAGGFDAGQTRA